MFRTRQPKLKIKMIWMMMEETVCQTGEAVLMVTMIRNLMILQIKLLKSRMGAARKLTSIMNAMISMTKSYLKSRKPQMVLSKNTPTTN